MNMKPIQKILSDLVKHIKNEEPTDDYSEPNKYNYNRMDFVKNNLSKRDDLYDIGIVVSGDGDYTYAIKAVKELGKYVEVVAFSSNLSKQLADESDYLIQLSPKYFSNLWINNKRKFNYDNRKNSRYVNESFYRDS